jgi:hypothetical protein
VFHRPVRLDPERDLDHRGFFASYVMIEEGCLREKTWSEDPLSRKRFGNRKAIVPPWREFKASPRRAAAIAFGLSKKDLSFIYRERDFWKDDRRAPVLQTIFPWGRTIPRDFMSHCDLLWALDYKTLGELQKSLGYRRTCLAPWWDFPFPPVTPRYDFGLAHDWGETSRRRRRPDAGRAIANGLGEIAPVLDRPDSAEQVAMQTDCKVYLAMSQREETYPWDVLIAAARGASVVVPKTQRYEILLKRLPSRRKLFYKVQNVGEPGLLHWHTGEVRGWIRQALQKLEHDWRPGDAPSARRSSTSA